MNSESSKISGYTVVRNAIEFDCSVGLAVESLLPLCEEVVIGYKESTDKTLELLETIKEKHPDEVRIVIQPWDNPHNDSRYVIRWMNETREHLRFPMQLMLDADEVLSDDPKCHAEIRRIAQTGGCSWFHRLNFVKDAWHLIPHGHCLGHMVARLGPTRLWMPADEPEPNREPEIRILAPMPPPSFMNIFHYGFLRNLDAFYRKMVVMNNLFFGHEDMRLKPYHEAMSPEWYLAGNWHTKIKAYTGKHPSIALEWLREKCAL